MRTAPAVVVAQASAAPPASIAIIPLVSIGADSANAYLAEGITNELVAALARIPNVHVVSPSRAASLLASGKAPSDVGKALNVELQLEGTVQREGKRLRVTARLVGVNDGVMRWSDMYERDATDLLTVQEELARAITDAIGTAMGGTTPALAARDSAPSPPASAGVRPLPPRTVPARAPQRGVAPPCDRLLRAGRGEGSRSGARVQRAG